MSGGLSLVRLEIRRGLRSARGRAVVGLLFFATLLASGLGSALAKAHQAAGAEDVRAAEARLRGRFRGDAGTYSPGEAARLTDTVIARPIPAIAALTAADLDALPDAATVRLAEPPRLVPARVERSAAAALLGTFDVSWLLALLMPLAVLALAYDAIARDRSTGALAMLLACAPSPTRLVLARTAGVAATVGLGVLPGLVLGLGMASAHLETPPDAVDALLVLVLAAASILAWSSLLVAASAFAARVGEGLGFGLGLWALLAVAAPLGGAALGPIAYPDPDPRDALEARQAVETAAASAAERWVEEEVREDPSLDPERAVDGVESTLRYDVLLARALRRRLDGAHHATRRGLARRAELAGLAAHLSPSTLTSFGLATLAHTDPEARPRFEADLRRFQAQLDLHVTTPLLAHEVGAGRLETWPKRTLAAPPARAPITRAIGLLLLLAAASLMTARVRLTRGPLGPSPEET